MVRMRVTVVVMMAVRVIMPVMRMRMHRAIRVRMAVHVRFGWPTVNLIGIGFGAAAFLAHKFFWL